MSRLFVVRHSDSDSDIDINNDIDIDSNGNGTNGMKEMGIKNGMHVQRHS